MMRFPGTFLGAVALLSIPAHVAGEELQLGNTDIVLEHIAAVNVAMFKKAPIDPAATNLNEQIRVSVQMRPGSPVETSTDILALQGIYKLFSADGTEPLGGTCSEEVVDQNGMHLPGMVSCALEGSDGRGGRKTFRVVYGLYEGKIRNFLLLGPQVTYVPEAR